jgi:hypothetical protein
MEVQRRITDVLDDPLVYIEIETALANRTSVPDVPGEVQRTLHRTCEALVEAEKLIGHTVAVAELKKTTRERKHAKPGRKAAGRRADEPLHDFVRFLDQVYEELAENPRSPGTVDRSSDAKGGELVELLDACLRPLGQIYETDGIVSLWRRATGRF